MLGIDRRHSDGVCFVFRWKATSACSIHLEECSRCMIWTIYGSGFDHQRAFTTAVESCSLAAHFVVLDTVLENHYHTLSKPLGRICPSYKVDEPSPCTMYSSKSSKC